MDDWYLVFDLRNGKVDAVFSTKDGAEYYADENRLYDTFILKFKAEMV